MFKRSAIVKQFLGLSKSTGIIEYHWPSKWHERIT